MTDTTVLITGSGAPGIIGTIWSVRQQFPSVNIIGVDIREQHVGKHVCDEFFTIPAPDTPEFIQSLLDICEQETVDVILPQVTNELDPLSKNRSAFERIGTTVAISPPEGIEQANNKATLIETCSQIGVEHPETTQVEAIGELREACQALGYPERNVVVKPPVSHGSRGFRILDADRDEQSSFFEHKPTSVYTTLEQLAETLGESFPSLLVMEYLPGPEFSVDCFRLEDDTVIIPRSRDEIRSGISFQGTVVDHSTIIDYCDRLAEELDLEYAFGFQFKEDSTGTPKILECNPRIQGSMVMSSIAGANLIGTAVSHAVGTAPPPLTPEWGTKFYRYWGGIGITDSGTAVNIGSEIESPQISTPPRSE